jgi:hypothetical protein
MEDKAHDTVSMIETRIGNPSRPVDSIQRMALMKIKGDHHAYLAKQIEQLWSDEWDAIDHTSGSEVVPEVLEGDRATGCPYCNIFVPAYSLLVHMRDCEKSPPPRPEHCNSNEYIAEVRKAFLAYNDALEIASKMEGAISELPSRQRCLRLQLVLSFATALHDLSKQPHFAVRVANVGFNEGAYMFEGEGAHRAAASELSMSTVEYLRQCAKVWEEELFDRIQSGVTQWVDPFNGQLADVTATEVSMKMFALFDDDGDTAGRNRRKNLEAEEFEKLKEMCRALMQLGPSLKAPLDMTSFLRHFGHDAGELVVTLSAAIHEVFNFYAESHVNAAKSVGGSVCVDGKKVDIADYLLTAKEDASFVTFDGLTTFMDDFGLVPYVMGEDEAKAVFHITLEEQTPIIRPPQATAHWKHQLGLGSNDFVDMDMLEQMQSHSILPRDKFTGG